MRVEISESAHSDVLDGYWLYNRQELGLGEYQFPPQGGHKEGTEMFWAAFGSVWREAENGTKRNCKSKRWFIP